MTSRLAFSSSHVQYGSEGIQAGAVADPAATADQGMTIRQFLSEAYPTRSRKGAWQDILSEFGLRSDAADQGLESFATASLRGDRQSLLLARLTAGDQTLSPLVRRPGGPIALISLDESLEMRLGSETLLIEAGSLVIVPAVGEWQLCLRKSARMIVLSIADSLFPGHKAGLQTLKAPRHYVATGIAAIFIKTVETAAGEMDSVSELEWRSLEGAIADLFVAIVLQAETHDAAASPGSAALFHRVTLGIERHLHEPELTALRIARLEGISERYLQKLFLQNGESISNYIRERRLQRARAALVAPGEIRLPIAEIAYSCGFGDAANFNRLFKERFGLPPGAFRSRHLEKLAANTNAEQRGWPLSALVAKRLQQRSIDTGDAFADSDGSEAEAGSSVHHVLAASAATVHWGYFSRALPPVLEIRSGDTVEIQTLTQHASDAPELMIHGDAGAEDVFYWTAQKKSVDRRGAGPIDASIYGRGAGEGFGVHICTGPIYVKDAEPGDVIEVRINSISPRPSNSPGYEGRAFGSSVAAWWGYHYNEFIQEPKARENITIYEVFADEGYAEALYSYRWQPQADPFGVVHRTYDYPGVPVDRSSVEICSPVLEGVRIPLRPHFGVIAVAPREAELVDSVPPSYFGGNLDNWRLGQGSAVYLPVSVPGALLSIGDPHAAQGDGELGGTAIECSMTGDVTVILHKKGELFVELSYPLLETPTEWILIGFSHPNYLAEFGKKGQGEVYANSSLDLAMKDAFRKARRFLMESKGLTEDEAIALMSAAVDFGVTQVVDGNWAVHAIIRKSLFRV